MSSRGEQLQRAVTAQKNFRERAGRVSRHRRAAQKGVAEKIRLRAAAADGDAGTNRRHFRLWRQGGVTVCVASGDNGSTDGSSDGSDQVDFPASSPYSLACGGTSLDISGGAIGSEVVWNDLPNDGATGGGVSATFPLPSWQANAKVPKSANPGAIKGRGVPDVAGDADPQTGYQVQADGSKFVVGGTSAVAPLWAGLVAMLNQKAGKPVGYLNPNLYP